MPAQPNLQQLMAQAQKMQQQMMAAQAELAETHVTGETAGGTRELVSLEIAPSVVDPADVETLQDLVVAAVRDATARAEQLAADKMGPLSAGIGGMGLPGF
jgi:DNA-binding YbaB/EbfC family protein